MTDDIGNYEFDRLAIPGADLEEERRLVEMAGMNLTGGKVSDLSGHPRHVEAFLNRLADACYDNQYCAHEDRMLIESDVFSYDLAGKDPYLTRGYMVASVDITKGLHSSRLEMHLSHFYPEGVCTNNYAFTEVFNPEYGPDPIKVVMRGDRGLDLLFKNDEKSLTVRVKKTAGVYGIRVWSDCCRLLDVPLFPPVQKSEIDW